MATRAELIAAHRERVARREAQRSDVVKSKIESEMRDRATHLNKLFQHVVHAVSTHENDAELREALGEKIIAEISGDFYVLKSIAEEIIGIPMPITNVIVTGFLNTLSAFYVYGNSTPIREFLRDPDSGHFVIPQLSLGDGETDSSVVLGGENGKAIKA